MKTTEKAGHKWRYAEAESLLTQTKGLLLHFDLQTKKRLGQHFLIDKEVLRLIISTAELAPADTVIEVGPGLGVLTRELVKSAGQVLAVELDNKLAATLKKTLGSYHNVDIINEDILDIEPLALLQGRESLQPLNNPFNYKVVANLPYYITSPVLRHFLQASMKPETMIVMVQKEVAKAIVARPGQMSMLSVSVQFYGEPRIVDYVPAHCFHPVPEVDSAILRIDLYPQPAVAVTDEKSFFELMRAGFTTSRKQIVNSLTQGLGLSKTEVSALLEGADIVSRRRAETLTLEEWARLWRVFIGVKGERWYVDGAGTGQVKSNS
ncbi:16S rRNA (adenine(1518)-N(6)/adenine(1519)-N(6))-dimethyltransferase RsmA [Candidatus Omnitrophota bacterium]